MTGQIIDISTDNKHLSIERGFITISEDSKELARFPIDNVEAVIANAHGITYTNNFLVKLAENRIPFVVCASNHNPVGFLLPIDGHYKQGAVMDAQIAASVPLNKKLWQEVVRSKIKMQASVLKFLGKDYKRLEELAKNVKSGDTDNSEAQAARFYWTALFESNFRRDRNAGGINALLNYGYTIVRSSTIRSIISAGLHPTLGIHHQNMLNNARLGDDLMEPFRPFVDMIVYKFAERGHLGVDSLSKKELVSVISRYIPSKIGSQQVSICIQNLCISLAKAYLKERDSLDLPLILEEMEWLDFNA
jgi:CRISPR-associated protein Cas1